MKSTLVNVVPEAILQQQVSPVTYDSCLVLARAERYEEATGSFEGLLNREPQNDKAWISYAQVRVGLGGFCLNGLLRVAWLSVVQMSKRRYMKHGAPSMGYNACESVLDRGVAANPKSAKLWQARGLLELQRGNQCEAKQLLERAVALDSRLSGVLKWSQMKEGCEKQEQE